MLLSRNHKVSAAVAAAAVMLCCTPLQAAFDGFNVLSSTFDNQYDGIDIWDGAAYASGWDGATASGGTTADYSLNGNNLVYNFSTNNGWLQHDNNTTPWELGSGSWTVEVRAKVGSTGGNSGLVIWGALNGERDILTVRENSVTNLGGTVFDSASNTDGFHDFRLVYDADADVYHYFRDAVQITPLTGIGQQGATGSTRLIVGDCCSNIGGSPFGGVGSSFELEYIRYDMTGAYSPTTDQGSTSLTIDRDTGNITLTNTTSTPIQDIVGYSILSAAGGLDQSGWTKQADGSQLSNDNDNWTVVTSAGVTTDLSEAVLSTTGTGNGGDLAATTGNWDFGNVWAKSPFEDVTMELLLDDGTILNSGTDFQLSYTGNDDESFGLGDLAGATVNDGPDGDIDLVDWQKFKAGYGGDVAGLTQVEAYFASDINGDGSSNISDFNDFRALYDAANGVGAFEHDLAAASVPEPAAWILALLATMGVVVRRPLAVASLRHSALALLVLVATAVTPVLAQVPVSVFSDDFQAYPLTDPADFSATGNWAHNGNGTAPNASRIFDTANYGGTRLWIASAANAAAGTGLDSRGITQAEGLIGNTDYTFSAAFVAETFTATRTASGTFDLLVGQSFGTATSVIGGPQAFAAQGDSDAGVIGSVDDTYDDQRTTLGFNTGTVTAGDQLFISFAFDGTDASNPFVGVDEVQILGEANIGAKVNTATGNVTLFGDTAFDFDITGYSLTSALGQLVPGSLTSLESQGVGDVSMTPDDGIGFEVLGTPSGSEIAEGHLTTFTTFDNTTDLSLGNIFNTATAVGDRDLALTLTTASGEELSAIVEYVTTTAVEGDYNGDGTVNLADYTVWRDNLGAANEAALNNNGDGGGVTASDYSYWKARFGNTAGSGSLVVGSAQVPEPATLCLLGLVGAAVGTRRLLRGVRQCLALLLVVACALPAIAAENDRQYDFGDDPGETASNGATMSGSTFDSAGSLGAGDLQDLFVNGSPTYVSVSNRPGASGSDLGASFNGSSDSLSTSISLNAPTQMWDNATFFPGPPPLVFPHNYEGIFSHGVQLWAKPNQATLGTATQTLVSDTNEHGIGISADGNWELLYDDGRFDTGVAVVDTLDANGWAHVMEVTTPTGGAFGGTLLINGVAVLTRATFYDPEATPLVIGADDDGSEGFENHYDGVIDDVRLFFWGDNSDNLGADNAVGGTNSGGPDPAPLVLNADGENWGSVGFMRSESLDRPGGVTNEWIAQELASMGVTDPGDVNLSGGAADAADEAAFIAHWRKQQVIDGVRVGDWNSRQEGDLNYDGIVDLNDVFILHESLTAAGAGGFNFDLLTGTTVPEPSTAVLAVGALIAVAIRSRRTRG